MISSPLATVPNFIMRINSIDVWGTCNLWSSLDEASTRSDPRYL
jgi:hypothetical protein